ncbi:uncharacterized protein PHALS_12407 [Plasmopara halstedii]|uniref:Uncharacterized protein n=1 Tax=Plasmopara halstedii TaxID=4781 RepID=A0A0P1ALU4_PLAHL|nr:uncharacterized protein PHALS_12407 [Plasmopara halstedii]CEG42103.1 hypothetical protein PHALS_12407 [Plasmopara halstedii]|eukprot:XP_024578472.1 hypothetical protein PHALS_12407 [Plasmopara halstedii]
MAESGDDNTRNLLQYIILAFLFALALSPFLLKLWKSAAYRERLRRSYCKNCSDIFSRRVHYDEADLRTLQELEQPPQREDVGINGAYRMYQARRCRLSLRLASWREDVKRGGGDDERLHHKLAQIQVAQSLNQQSQLATTRTSAPVNRASLASTIPFDIRVVEITDRVDESIRSSVAAVSSHTSSFSYDSDEDMAYELILPTPKNDQREVPRTERRSVVVEEDEEKEDDIPPVLEIV